MGNINWVFHTENHNLLAIIYKISDWKTILYNMTRIWLSWTYQQTWFWSWAYEINQLGFIPRIVSIIFVRIRFYRPAKLSKCLGRLEATFLAGICICNVGGGGGGGRGMHFNISRSSGWLGLFEVENKDRRSGAGCSTPSKAARIMRAERGSSRAWRWLLWSSVSLGDWFWCWKSLLTLLVASVSSSRPTLACLFHLVLKKQTKRG